LNVSNAIQKLTRYMRMGNLLGLVVSAEVRRMKKHKHQIDEGEVGFNLKTGEKDYYCKICQKRIATIKKV